jgi:uncharacterized protein (TIGR00369 family)
MNGSAFTPPPSFEPHFRKSPLTDPWEPLYSRQAGQSFVIGLLVRAPHTNARGLMHGGLIAALADNAIGLSCALAAQSQGGLVTVSLTVDLLGKAAVGDWIEFTATPAKIGRSLVYGDCRVTSGETLIAKASAIFSLPRNSAQTERSGSNEPA